MNELKRLRQERKLTQAQFAEWLEIPKRTYEKWETGERIPPQWVIGLIKDKCKKKEIFAIECNGTIQYVYENYAETRKWANFCKNVSKYSSVKILKGYVNDYVEW